MTRHQIKEYCEEEFENINAVTSERIETWNRRPRGQ